MLPKEENIKKNSDTKQPGLFDKENERDRIAKKRRFVYIAMFFTVGLSLFFWTYRHFKNFNFSFKLPTLNFKTVSTPKTSTLNLPQDSSTWSIFLKRINSDSIIYQKNQDTIFSNQDLNFILNQINQGDFINSSNYSSSLPQGLKIKELIQEDSKNFSYFSKINTPRQELLIIIKISDSKDLSQSKKSIPNLIDQLYWYSLQK